MTMISASKGIARILKAEDAPFASLFPSCKINNAIGDEGQIPLILMRDERFGVGVADAFSRLSDGKRFGVCTLQGGVNCAGFQFGLAAMQQAFEDSSPILCLTDAVNPGDTENSHYNMDRIAANFTRWTAPIPLARRVPEFMGRAYTFLKTGRPGPVLLQVPTSLGEYDEEQYPYKPIKGWKSQADPDDVKTAVKALLAAKKPLLYAGDGVFYGDACAELLQFAELSQIPVVTTLKAKSAFPETHPLSAGVRGEPADHYIDACDLLLAIGSSLSPNRFSHAIPNAKAKTIIQCTVDNWDINKSYQLDGALIGDAKLVLRQLIGEFSRQTGGGVKSNPEVLAEIRGLKAKLAEKYRAAMTSNDKPINPFRVYAELRNILDPKDSFITAESGGPRDQLSTVYESVIPHGYLGWGNISTLGFSLAGVIAAKIIHPDRPAVTVTGDAGLPYMIGNFEPAVRYKWGVTIIHINNSGFSGYGKGPWGAGQEPYTADVLSSNLCNLSKSMEGFGMHAERVTEPGEIGPAIRRALDANAAKRPAYIEVICSLYPVWGVWAGMSPKGASRSQTKINA
jgi:thiamine pyrophosphate-dependent acetolactate synthase large subunit-like protein